jgi:hypothetical protein
MAADVHGTSLGLVQVSVGNGVELGLDPSNVVYYRNWGVASDASGYWTRASGDVKMLSVAVGGPSGDFWVGYGVDNQLYFREDGATGEWSLQQQSNAWVGADDVQVAASGLGEQSVWVIDGYAGGAAWFMGDRAKEDTGVSAERIAMGGLTQSDAIAWIIGASSTVYSITSSNMFSGRWEWDQLDDEHSFSRLAVGGDSGDRLYAIDSSGTAYFRRGASGAWGELAGAQRHSRTYLSAATTESASSPSAWTEAFWHEMRFLVDVSRAPAKAGTEVGTSHADRATRMGYMARFRATT